MAKDYIEIGERRYKPVQKRIMLAELNYDDRPKEEYIIVLEEIPYDSYKKESK